MARCITFFDGPTERDSLNRVRINVTGTPKTPSEVALELAEKADDRDVWMIHHAGMPAAAGSGPVTGGLFTHPEDAAAGDVLVPDCRVGSTEWSDWADMMFSSIPADTRPPSIILWDCESGFWPWYSGAAVPNAYNKYRVTPAYANVDIYEDVTAEIAFAGVQRPRLGLPWYHARVREWTVAAAAAYQRAMSWTMRETFYEIAYERFPGVLQGNYQTDVSGYQIAKSQATWCKFNAINYGSLACPELYYVRDNYWQNFGCRNMENGVLHYTDWNVSACAEPVVAWIMRKNQSSEQWGGAQGNHTQTSETLRTQKDRLILQGCQVISIWGEEGQPSDWED
jgi:hypothetical protein